ncbi:MAG: transposase [Candidatus Levybacteria bacterium]|nr:transposase [Candidatus Levybacteria bacterium]
MKKQERLTVVRAFSKEYKRTSKKQKGVLLERLVQTTGYSRKHLMDILSQFPKAKRIRRKRVSKYLFVIKYLRKLWAISNYACGQRLAPMIPSYLAALRRHKELTVTKEERKLLCSISHATIDRLLKHERKRINLKGRSRTKPGTLLKHQIPIRTFADWNEKQPGFLEIDTVHHCGDSLRGDYVHTLDTTDVFTGWNECRAFMGKSERNTVEALEHIKQNKLPFPMLGIDFDTGGEFVNYHLIRYSDRNKISYTRAREGKKNDQNYIEQQNYSVVRRFVGYQRLDTPEQLQMLNQMYDLLSDYQNFFQPVMRLKEKVRNGTKVTRRYDKPKTAYQRVLADKRITQEAKKKLRERYSTLNPKRLLLKITSLGKKLSKR